MRFFQAAALLLAWEMDRLFANRVLPRESAASLYAAKLDSLQRQLKLDPSFKDMDGRFCVRWMQVGRPVLCYVKRDLTEEGPSDSVGSMEATANAKFRSSYRGVSTYDVFAPGGERFRVEHYYWTPVEYRRDFLDGGWNYTAEEWEAERVAKVGGYYLANGAPAPALAIEAIRRQGDA